MTSLLSISIIDMHCLSPIPDDTATLLLKSPRGISVDNDGNVYVVGCSSNNIVVISPDGQRHRQVLSSGDGLVKFV
jgi:DNA-binding beta-propeller fold protein YncE